MRPNAPKKQNATSKTSVRGYADPYDAQQRLSAGCSCGEHATQADHDQATAAPRSEEAKLDRVVESAVVRAMFPNDAGRRRFLKAVGASTAMAAISSFFPMKAARALANESNGPLERTDLNIGFIPITCATPIIMAEPMGFYAEQGLNARVIKAAGWAVIRDRAIAGEFDAAHMLSPMPLSLTMGAGTRSVPYTMPAVENINGQAITLSNRHQDKRDPAQWRGFRFAVPFDYSMHNLLLRYYVAEHGLDPDRDIQIRVIPPPEMVANLRAGNVDGYLAPDPFNQRAVFDGIGFIHMLSKDIWDGHPCCAFAASREFVEQTPNTFLALFRAIISATDYASNHANRAEIAEAIAPRNYLNQPVTVLEQVLTGRYADGLGGIQNDPDRIGFDPFPWHSMAVWILTQMKRWGYIEGDVDYPDIAEQVFLATDAGRVMREQGMNPPETTYANHTIMGKAFDPAEPEQYIESFDIRRG